MPNLPAPLLRPILPAALAVLAGCATFHPLPLANGRGPRRVTNITVPTQAMSTTVLRAHQFVSSNGLYVTEVAMREVANDP
jgi:hypothetical protein